MFIYHKKLKEELKTAVQDPVNVGSQQDSRMDEVLQGWGCDELIQNNSGAGIMPGSQQFGVGSSPPPDTGQHQQKRSNIRNVEMVYLSDDEPLPSSNQTHSNSQGTIQAGHTDQTTISERVKHLNLDNKYSLDSPRPYVVFVEHKYLNVGRLHPMRLGEKLLNIGNDARHIKEINTVGRNRIKIELDSPAAANRILSNSVFENNGLVAYIPLHLTEKKGVVKGIDTTYSEEDLLKKIVSDIPVKSVKRMYKVNKNSEEQTRLPRQMIIITFAKLAVPQYISINKLRFRVDNYYSPVLMCYNCLRYGHTSTLCKSKKKCKNCGTECNDGSVCSNCSPFCIHCKSTSHSSTDRECPAFLKQKRTKEAMAHLNVSFEEAEKIVDHPSYASLTSKNRYAPLMSSNTEFPSLPTKPTPPIHVTPQIPKSQWSNINDSQQKKRKIHHTEPQFPPVRREFQWSFCGKPVIDANNPQEVLTFQEIRDKLTSELSTNLTTLLQVHSRGDVDTVLDNFNLKSMIEALLRNIFQSYVQPSSEGGDFNGHHYLWGSTDNNSPGLTLVDAIDDFPHLIFRNEGQPTRLTRPSANISAVDVTIISTDLLDISTWTVMSDTYGSDHFPILMNINSTTTNIDSHSTYKWRIHPHPDWNRFADMVNPSLIWKRAKSIRKGISHQNSKTMSAEEAEVMLKKLAPDWATLPVSSTEPYYNHFLLEEITVAEFDACIKNHDTAPGLDGITYSMIGNLPRRAKELLCVAFNKIVQTDSRSVLEALNSKHLYTHEVIKEILAKMYRLQQRQISVTLLWVKGHSGITGNLQADALAKNAIASDNIIDAYTKTSK
nr:unnamed protein product [Callosobruchus analis]